MPQNNQTLLEKTVADQWQTLPSGLTVIVRPMPGYSSTHVIFATRFGSIDRDFRLDGKEVHLPAGVAHFLEHKMFEDQDGDAFAKYAKTGANANAFTSFDRTCYLFTATQQLDESLDVLLGMVTHPYFTEQTIAKEQGIIGQEIKMYDDSPDWRLITGLFECLYHEHPIRSDIAGTVESIAEITPEMLYDSCKAFYAPGNMVLAAAGGHNVLLIGAPGTGKSMLAKRLPGILPPLTREEAVETTKIYSIAGQMPKGRGLVTARPFRSPHHSASAVSLAGGGAQFRPGECSLANCGVLFLDELPEFSRESLEVLRQPLEDGQITVSRAAGSATYPSHFQLVAAMNPCKCGYYGHPTRPCTCSLSAVRQYRSRVSGPLLDRIDLCVEMDPVAFDELHGTASAESSADLRRQVLFARQVQAKRYAAPGFEGVHCNARLTAGQVRRVCRMTPAAERLLRASYETLGLSARAHDRILRVARTVADLAGKQLLDEDSLLEALQYRAQEKVEL